jgi:ferredoxin
VRVTADRDLCCQAGRCADALPDVFDNDEDGYVVVLRAEVEPDRLRAVRECVDLCPSGALRLDAEAGGPR